VNPLLLLPLAYLVGATPTSLWVGKGIYGVDLRTRGSGNLGATNTFRVLGWKAALPVFAVDVLKGWGPVWLFPRIDAAGASWGWAAAYGAAAIVGHVFSLWVQFRGGKGVATGAGVFLALAPLATFGALIVWIVALLTSRRVSVASILAALVLPVAVAFTRPAGGGTLLAFAVALAAFIVWAHRSNLARLARGEEPRIGRGGGRPRGADGTAPRAEAERRRP